ncbi:MAG: hypothetical protein IT246_06390 [Bacteroidia bacterium]|nr:hypothetical protein [Bacteroidia bacterium]
MKLISFTQQEIFPTTALDIYSILLDSRKCTSFTGEPAIVSDKEGDSFSLFDNTLIGKNIVLERGELIIWSFRLNDDEWPETVTTEAAIVLKNIDPISCKIELFLTAVPIAFEEQLKQLWNENIWEALRYYIER